MLAAKRSRGKVLSHPRRVGEGVKPEPEVRPQESGLGVTAPVESRV